MSKTFAGEPDLELARRFVKLSREKNMNAVPCRDCGQPTYPNLAWCKDCSGRRLVLDIAGVDQDKAEELGF